MKESKLPNILQQHLKTLKSDDNVYGVILFGSWARGNNRADSDIDLIIVSGSEVRRDINVVEGTNFELVLTTEVAAKEFWESNKDDCADLWSYAKVLFDRDGTVARLRVFANELISAGKSPIPEWQLRHMRFDCDDSLRSATKLFSTDPLTARLLLYKKVFDLTEIYFNKRCQWTPAPKQCLAVLKEKDPLTYELFAKFYSSTDQVNFTALIEVARTIVERVFAGYEHTH